MSTPMRPTTRTGRLDDIIDVLVRDGSAAPQQLADLFGVSVMTIHRDLDELQRLGVVRKFYGGVSVERTTSFEIAASLRRRLATGVKREIGRCAAELVEPGQTIMLDDSTTVATMAERLAGAQDVRLWTNFLPLLTSLVSNRAITVNAIGGRYDPSHESFLGAAAVEAVRRIRVDTVFVSTTTADATGFFHQEEDIVQLKTEMLRSARRRVMMLDATKLDRISQFLVGSWDGVDDLITDDRAPTAFLAAVRAAGVEVHTVRTNEGS